MLMKSRALIWSPLIALTILLLLGPAPAAGQAASQAAPQNPPTRITLDDAVDLALKHNHSLQAARTTILQNQALEITANLRPNPVGLIDEQYMPFFSPTPLPPTTSISPRYTTWDSPIRLNSARRDNIGLRPPKTRPL